MVLKWLFVYLRDIAYYALVYGETVFICDAHCLATAILHPDYVLFVPVNSNHGYTVATTTSLDICFRNTNGTQLYVSNNTFNKTKRILRIDDIKSIDIYTYLKDVCKSM